MVLLLKNMEEECADIYVYRLAEKKAIIIGRVSRILKQCSVDCLLNSSQMGFTVEQMNQTLSIKLSSKKEIDYQVGDRPYSSICDYMKTCQYSCTPSKEISEKDIKRDTYGEEFIMTNSDKLVYRIKTLFKEKYVYYKKDLIKSINIIREYPIDQINAALQQLVEDNSEFVADRYGRLGNIVNIGQLYLFQPLELKQKHISRDQRSIPIPFKRDSLTFVEPKIVKPEEVQVVNDDTSKETKLLTELQERYETGSTYQTIVRGETDIYKFWSDSIKLIEDTGISKDILLDFFVSHLVQVLNYPETVILLNYLEKPTTEKEILHPELKDKIKSILVNDILQIVKLLDY